MQMGLIDSGQNWLAFEVQHLCIGCDVRFDIVAGANGQDFPIFYHDCFFNAESRSTVITFALGA